MSVMTFRETMWAEMTPDLYDGEGCDQVKAQWTTHAEGDMDSERFEHVILDSKVFPPGTRIVVLEPVCPECGCVASYCEDTCTFDWKDWVVGKYA